MKFQEVYLILDNLRSAYNVGSAFRTADAAGVKKILICGLSPYPPHIKLAKTALGATNFVDWEYFKHTKDAISSLKKQKITVYGVECGVNGAQNYKLVEYPARVALIFGNEVEGISKQILAKCDKIIEIPMKGRKNSLNVATAIGIILYNLT